MPRVSEPQNPLRILIVEDDELIGVMLAEMLDDLGYAVCAVETTEADAVNAASHHRPDLMIVDARLGAAGCGVSAVEEILRNGFVPHVFMSGNILRVKALRPRAVTLQKPFRKAELTRAIEHALDAAVAP